MEAALKPQRAGDAENESLAFWQTAEMQDAADVRDPERRTAAFPPTKRRVYSRCDRKIVERVNSAFTCTTTVSKRLIEPRLYASTDRISCRSTLRMVETGRPKARINRREVHRRSIAARALTETGGRDRRKRLVRGWQALD